MGQALAGADKAATNSESEQGGMDFRTAAKQWSLRVMQRAGAMYAEGPVQNDLKGRSLVKFRFLEDGTTADCQTLVSSGHPQLDQITCRAVLHTIPSPVKLNDAGNKEAVWAQLPVRFVIGDKHELEEGAP